MKHPLHSLLLLSLVAGAVAATGVAATSNPVEAGAAPAPAAKPARTELLIGMPAAQVRELIGAPRRVKTIKREGVAAEVWFYSYRAPAGIRQVVTGTRDIPYVDPITGVMRSIPEPIYSQERLYLEETTELLIVDGTLAASRRYRASDKSYN